ncbi:hypothetical protein JAAARDRAFT_210178 [Jaapia argillacea MUCL 33604]|uniref:Uncharacterized protein n=1 Tax=Jaapia argillacea MUCL 33604 TaxID=933084 RepID=A0A067PPN4_9AGAM|nr:hypothetical protein JAAARDRAFT_210178 [Jaapia argillacea MUCL 33604]
MLNPQPSIARQEEIVDGIASPLFFSHHIAFAFNSGVAYLSVALCGLAYDHAKPSRVRGWILCSCTMPGIAVTSHASLHHPSPSTLQISRSRLTCGSKRRCSSRSAIVSAEPSFRSTDHCLMSQSACSLSVVCISRYYGEPKSTVRGAHVYLPLPSVIPSAHLSSKITASETGI